MSISVGIHPELLLYAHRHGSTPASTLLFVLLLPSHLCGLSRTSAALSYEKHTYLSQGCKFQHMALSSCYWRFPGTYPSKLPKNYLSFPFSLSSKLLHLLIQVMVVLHLITRALALFFRHQASHPSSSSKQFWPFLQRHWWLIYLKLEALKVQSFLFYYSLLWVAQMPFGVLFLVCSALCIQFVQIRGTQLLLIAHQQVCLDLKTQDTDCLLISPLST